MCSLSRPYPILVCLLFILFFTTIPGPLLAATINVPADFATIQDALDAAVDNDIILVADGVYKGERNRNLNFNGKALTLTSENGPENCVIHCELLGTGVVFDHGETERSILSGFTITYGVEHINPWGGAIVCAISSPTIENCRFINNRNAAIWLYHSNARISACEFVDNKNTHDGGAMFVMGGAPAIENSIFRSNISYSSYAGVHGGGAINFGSVDPGTRVVNCLFSDNIAFGTGGAIRSDHGDYSVINCTFSNNTSFYGLGGAICHFAGAESYPDPEIKNSIFWGNRPNQIIESNIYSTINVSYSNIQGGYEGVGNIDQDPMFFDPQGDDYTLDLSSPSIDKGTSDGAPSVDIENTPRPLSGGVDMGAYEAPVQDQTRPLVEVFNTSVLTGDIPLEVVFTCSASDVDGSIAEYTVDFGDGSPLVSNASGIFTRLYTLPGISHPKCVATDNEGKRGKAKSLQIEHRGESHVPEDYENIQEAIDSAVPGGTVTVSDGIYTGSMNKNIKFWTKAITLQSLNGPESTIIDCENDGRGFHFGQYEGNDSVLSGFTITNGNAIAGAGIYCRYSSPSINNCIIESNSATRRGIEFGGGGLCLTNYSSPIISNCIIQNNSSDGYGGGITAYSDCSPTIRDTAILNNQAATTGGGIVNYWESNLLIENCQINGNTSQDYGGGIYSRTSYLWVLNSYIIGNSAGESGGGIYCGTRQQSIHGEVEDNAIILHSTIVNNSAANGGGIYFEDLYSPASVTNSIFWGNTSNQIEFKAVTPGSNTSEPVIRYSNIMGGYPGAGNMVLDPEFVSASDEDFRLSIYSPCIDAGASLWGLGFDFDNDARPYSKGYDIGADENVDDNDSDSIPDAWEVKYGLDPTVDDASNDYDGDGSTNLEEYVAGSNPFVVDPVRPTITVPEETDLVFGMRSSDFEHIGDDADHMQSRWQIGTTSEFLNYHDLVLDVMSDNYLTTLHVAPLLLSSETTYFARVQYFDSQGGISQWSPVEEFYTKADPNDSNQNGVPDNQEVDDSVDLDFDRISDNNDSDIMSLRTLIRDEFNGVQVNERIGTAVSVVSLDPETIVGEDQKPENIVDDIIVFKLQLHILGDDAHIQVYYSERLPGDITVYGYDIYNGWIDELEYSISRGDTSRIGYTITDGGTGDMDGVANGTIVHAIGYTSEEVDNSGPHDTTEGGGGGGGGCFLSTVRYR